MALKAVLDTLDGVEPAIAALYSEQTVAGKTVFVLDVDGVDSLPTVRSLKTAHDANRTKLTKAQTDLATAQARLDGLPDDFDADAYAELKDRADKGTKAPDPVETERQLQERIGKATKKANDEKLAAEKARDTYRDRYNNSERDKVIAEQLAKAGITDPIYLKAARAMLIANASVIENEDGTLSVLMRDLDLDIQTPAAEFIKSWAEGDEGKAFVGARQNAGGGAGGGDGGKSGVRVNPYKAETFNLTEQSRIEEKDPALAKRLRAEAGVKED